MPYTFAKLIFSVLVIVFATGVFAALEQERSTLSFVVYLISAYAALLVVVWVDHQSGMRRARWRSDTNAADFISDAAAASDQRYALILRSFDDDQQLAIDRGQTHQNFVLNLVYGVIDIQEWVIRALPASWRCVTVGGTALDVRPVRVQSTEQSWRQDVSALAEYVDLIVILPGASQSLGEEVRYMLKHHITKLVFVFPPQDGRKHLYTGNREFYRKLNTGDALQVEQFGRLRNGAIVVPLKLASEDKIVSVAVQLSRHAIRAAAAMFSRPGTRDLRALSDAWHADGAHVVPLSLHLRPGTTFW